MSADLTQIPKSACKEKCLKVWNCRNKYVSLQANIEKMMKESKPYPQFDEEDGSSMMASEPVGAVAFAEEAVETKYLHIPELPETWDELLDCLKEGEEASVSLPSAPFTTLELRP